MENGNIDRPHFVKSHDFHGDSEYIAWIQEIKTRYQRIRSRIALQTNYGALEFNWLLERDLVEKKAEQHWGAGVVEQISLDLRAAYPDVKGFSSRNLWYMKQWYLFYRGDAVRSEKLHQLGAELQSLENHNPVKLHQLGAEMVSPQRIATILDNGEMFIDSTSKCNMPIQPTPTADTWPQLGRNTQRSATGRSISHKY